MSSSPPGCVCNAEGTVNGGRCDDNTGLCQCKMNVEGPRCDRCKRGYYGLSASNPLGCTSESGAFLDLFSTTHTLSTARFFMSLWGTLRYVQDTSGISFMFPLSHPHPHFLLSRVFLFCRGITVRRLRRSDWPVSLSAALPRPYL